MNPETPSYWRWFIRGSGGKPGYRRLLNSYIVVHGALGYLLAQLVPDCLEQCAKSVLLPLAGILVGLSFAWAGNAQALLQSSEIEEMTDHHEGGFAEYVYVYQTAILVILTTLVVWGLAGMRVFDARWPTSHSSVSYFIVKWVLFLFSSLTLRECWHVVIGAQWMLLTRREIRRARQQASNEGKSSPSEN